MRLIVTHPDDPGAPSTWSKAPYNLIAALREQGVDVLTVATGRGRLVERMLFRVLQHSRGSDFTFAPLFRRYAQRKVGQAVRRTGVSAVLHCASTSAVPTGRSPARHYLYCDSTWHRYVTLSPGTAAPPARIIAQVDRLEAIAYQRLNHIFAFSNAAKADIVGYFSGEEAKITVIGTGCGNTVPYFGPKEYGNGVLLYVAVRAPRQKGGQLLLAGFDLAVRKNPRLSLIMEGGSIPSEMATGIPNVTLRGRSGREELQQLFNQASLYAMPALFEPWGNVYIEALASRTPVLGLNRHSLPDITRQGRFGFLIDDAAPEAVSRAILDACSDPTRLDRMGREGQQHVLSNYTWPIVAGRILARIKSDAEPARRAAE